MEEKKEVKLAKSIIPYWRGQSVSPRIIRIIKSNITNNGKDAIAFAEDIVKEIGFNKLIIGKWNIRCPYCGYRFEVQDNKVIRCPNCNNVIKKVNFENWNNLIEKYVNFEITSKELNESAVIPSDTNFELLKNVDNAFLAKTYFRVGIYGFNRIFKFFSPIQIHVISTLISKMRETEDSIRPILSLALLDYLSYNSMFARLNGNNIKSMFYALQPKISWKWVILPSAYFIKSINAVLKQNKEIYVPSLNYDLQEEIYNFYVQFLKSTLSNLLDGILTPHLYFEYFFDCLDAECKSFVEKSRQKISLDDLLEGKSIFLLKIIREDDIISLLHSGYRIISVKYENKGFRIHIDKNREETVTTIAEIHAKLKDKKIEGEDVEALANAFEVILREFTNYKKIIGVKGLDDVFNEVINVLCNSINCNISDRMAKYYIIGKYYGRSKKFFRMLYMITRGTKIKFNENNNTLLGLLAKVRRDPTVIRKIPANKAYELIQILRILSNKDTNDAYKEILSEVKEEIEFNSS